MISVRLLDPRRRDSRPSPVRQERIQRAERAGEYSFGQYVFPVSSVWLRRRGEARPEQSQRLKQTQADDREAPVQPHDQRQLPGKITSRLFLLIACTARSATISGSSTGNQFDIRGYQPMSASSTPATPSSNSAVTVVRARPSRLTDLGDLHRVQRVEVTGHPDHDLSTSCCRRLARDGRRLAAENGIPVPGPCGQEQVRTGHRVGGDDAQEAVPDAAPPVGAPQRCNSVTRTPGLDEPPAPPSLTARRGGGHQRRSVGAAARHPTHRRRGRPGWPSRHLGRRRRPVTRFGA